MAPSTMTAVVCGATGNQGGAVLSALLDAGGWRVIGLTRSTKSKKSEALSARGVEMVEANLDDESSLDAALLTAGDRIQGVFCVTNYYAGNTGDKEVTQMQALLRAVERHGGVDLFVYSSCGSCDPATRPGFNAKGMLPDFDTRWACERILLGGDTKVSGLVIRPAQFADNFFGVLEETHLATDKAFGWPGFDTKSDVKHALVTLGDIGRFVETAMRQGPNGFAGKTLDLASFALTSAELLEIYEVAKGLPPGSVKPKGAYPLWLFRFIMPGIYYLFKFFNTADFAVDIDACKKYMPTQTAWADVVKAHSSSA